MVVGESMGAVNALLVALRRPGRVDRVAALCPPLSTGSPFAGLAETSSLVAASSTTWQRAFMLRGLARHFFRSEAAWRRHDPVRLAREASAEETPELYLLCGRRDEWGCMEGSLALVEAARAREASGVSMEASGSATRALAIEWHPRDGGHCDVDVPSLARFLTR
jgi:pimeloyl-ACP methyl ester carboxylesterase